MTTMSGRVLQITDLHFFTNTNGKLLGVNTFDSFKATLEQVSNSLAKYPPDLVLLTGDLAQESTEEAYRRITDEVKIFECPIGWIPGNHDNPKQMQKSFSPDRHASNICSDKHFILGNWQIILLDSHLAGEVGGKLEDNELHVLENYLKSYPDHYALVVLHHHVLPVGSHWLDNLGLKKPEKIIRILKKYPNVKICLSGHVHQDNKTFDHDITFLTSPSTCVQFKQNSDEFAVDNLPPGYRWFEFFKDGTFQTEAVFIDGFETTVDLQSKGYK